MRGDDAQNCLIRKSVIVYHTFNPKESRQAGTEPLMTVKTHLCSMSGTCRLERLWFSLGPTGKLWLCFDERYYLFQYLACRCVSICVFCLCIRLVVETTAQWMEEKAMFNVGCYIMLAWANIIGKVVMQKTSLFCAYVHVFRFWFMQGKDISINPV